VTYRQPQPEDLDLELLHHRRYDVKSYRETSGRLRLRGTVIDEKPGGVYFAGDPNPVAVHHMVLDVVVAFPSLEIVEAEMVMKARPHTECTDIEPKYGELVGLSIARGFTHKVRELFGGPRGCSHTTALLQAMAPVAIQSTWSMRALSDTEQFVPPPLGKNPTKDELQARFGYNLNSCHVWAEDGEVINSIKRGEQLEPPLWAIERSEALGISVSEWRLGGESD
jgi:hypothetical protein